MQRDLTRGKLRNKMSLLKFDPRGQAYEFKENMDADEKSVKV